MNFIGRLVAMIIWPDKCSCLIFFHLVIDMLNSIANTSNYFGWTYSIILFSVPTHTRVINEERFVHVSSLINNSCN